MLGDVGYRISGSHWLFKKGLRSGDNVGVDFSLRFRMFLTVFCPAVIFGCRVEALRI